MGNEELIELRAALIQFEKTLETERACVIRIRKVLEKRLSIQPSETVTISPRDSLAGYGTETKNGL